MRAARTHPEDRLNVLLTDHGQNWADQLPQLLEPQGVRALRADSVQHAIRILESAMIHVAVVDLELPMESTPAPARPEPSRLRAPGGLTLLQSIQRLRTRPPAVVVVRGRMFEPRFDNHVLREALRFDAFSVLDQPVSLEQMLEVLRRALERFFGGNWPES